MLSESQSAHFGLGRFALLIGILATLAVAVAVVGNRKAEVRRPVVVDGWEDDFSA
jgi:hypothetical protein